MATIKVHQDICNFQKKFFGVFTGQQLLGVGLYAACVFLIKCVMCDFALGLPWFIGMPIAIVVPFPVAFIGFVKLHGIKFQDALSKYIDLTRRGDVLVAEAETFEQGRSEINRVWAKEARKRASECGR